VITQFFLALQFLTIIPIRIPGTVRDVDLPRSMGFYPLVGALLGGLGALVFRVTLHYFSPTVAVVAAVVSLIVFSGGLHLDGFADMCDGFYGHRDRDQILAIMKDSRSGAMAIMGVFSLLALKVALLSNLDGPRAMLALILAPAVGRWSMVWLCASSTYARSKGGTASAYIGHVDKGTVLMATLFGAGMAFLLFRLRGLLAMAVAAGFTSIFRRYTERRINGMTGDTLGACCECVEVVTLAVLGFHGAGA
jgi:adenosylcobinamide-GDP ribazoletransferase